MDERLNKSVNDLSTLTRQRICKKLDIRIDVGGDFRTLAAYLNMESDDLDLIAQSSDCTHKILRWWGRRPDSTISKLRNFLVEMRREDCVEIIDKSLETGLQRDNKRQLEGFKKWRKENERRLKDNKRRLKEKKRWLKENERWLKAKKKWLKAKERYLKANQRYLKANKRWLKEEVSNAAVERQTVESPQRDRNADEAASNSAVQSQMIEKLSNGFARVSIKGICYITRHKICRLLNIEQRCGGDFRSLAAKFNMSSRHLDLISRRSCPTDEVLEWIERNPENTLENLRQILLEIGRQDCVDILDKDQSF